MWPEYGTEVWRGRLGGEARHAALFPCVLGQAFVQNLGVGASSSTVRARCTARLRVRSAAGVAGRFRFQPGVRALRMYGPHFAGLVFRGIEQCLIGTAAGL